MRFKIYRMIFTAIFGLMALNSAYAVNIDRIVAFGDSLSDNGNLYRYTTTAHTRNSGFPIIPDQPYWQGHFSNGPTWVEELVDRFKHVNHHAVTLNDYAVGGAIVQLKTPAIDEIVWPRYTIHDEVFVYLHDQSTNLRSTKRHLYSLWMGSNDYILLLQSGATYDPDALTTNVVNVIKNDILALIQDVDAKQFIILNLPDLGITPGGQVLGDDIATGLSELSKLHNQKLQQAIDELTVAYPQVTFVTVDIFSAMNSLINDNVWRGERIKDVTFPCYAGDISSQRSRMTVMMKTNKFVKAGNLPVCSDPDDHLFWDWIHPTHHIHKMIADEALTQLGLKDLR